ncbi:MAG: phytoene desaturase [Alphaproteobacteria bacterium]|jgi:phytoene desaturase|nr:phytoene desaturase [Alphaproteobacteria bacterium]
MSPRDDLPYAPPAAGSARHTGQRVVVIGGGFGGIAAALRLRAQGRAVTLVERLDRLGGRAQVYESRGVRFDAGPTVVTAPYLFDELFALFGRRREDYVGFLPVAPWYRFRFADGEAFDYGPDEEATRREIARLSPGDLPGYERMRAHAGRLYRRGFEELGTKSFHRLADLLRLGPDMLRLGGHRSVYAHVGRYLKDERLRQAFSIQPLLVGGNPLSTTAIYALIQELECRFGVVFPQGGTGALVDALTRLLEETGVAVRCGETVAEIETAGRRVTGVRLDSGGRLPADRVVADVDPAHLYGRMLPGARRRRWTDRRLPRLRYAMGLFVLYFTTDCPWPDIAHHTIVLNGTFAEELGAVFDGGRLVERPSLYLHRPGATDPGMAPPGGDAFYALAAVPNLRAGLDWAREGPALQERVIDRLEATEMPGLRRHVTDAFFRTPEAFAHDYLARYGTGFTIQPLFTQSAWFRFHNRSEEVDGLYLVGAGTHPGAGLPGVLSSAKIVESLLAADRPVAHQEVAHG